MTVTIDGFTANKRNESRITLPLGTTLVLVCEVVGISQDVLNYTNYTWTYPNTPSIQQGYVSLIKQHVVAINITSEYDSGEYICNVFNDHGPQEYKAFGKFDLDIVG